VDLDPFPKSVDVVRSDEQPKSIDVVRNNEASIFSSYFSENKIDNDAFEVFECSQSNVENVKDSLASLTRPSVDLNRPSVDLKKEEQKISGYVTKV